MSRDWKPGDVAMVRRGSANWHRAIWTEDLDTPGWHCVHGPCSRVTNARPLVVIDPENREQVERLVRSFWNAQTPDHGGSSDFAYMQAALRSLIEPPKPPFKPGDVAQLGMGEGGRTPVIAFRTKGGYWIDTDGVTIEDAEPWWVNPIFVSEDDPTEGVTP